MAEQGLQGRRILVVEDEYFIAEEIARTLATAGAEVLGPAPTVERAMALLAAYEAIDASVLDVNLSGTMAFTVADALVERGVRFVFATGYSQTVLPDRFAAVRRIEKPFAAQMLPSLMARLLESPDPGASITRHG